jgi:hypothetical protein
MKSLCSVSRADVTKLSPQRLEKFSVDDERFVLFILLAVRM